MSADDHTGPQEQPEKKGFNLAVFLPVGIFFALTATFALLLLMPGRNAATIPSALIGQPAPTLTLPALEGANLPGFDPAQFDGVTVVNVWASWCGPCRLEHPLLMSLAEDERISIAGINYKDLAANANTFLAELGNPYDVVGTDNTGRVSIDWGVYGVPETFIVDADGTIVWKHAGPITEQIVLQQMMPEIERLAPAR
ncbi:MAG: DsbE family thiol:disulfide interchange protein [Ahrensia sp.]